LDVPSLSNFGITEDYFPELVARSKKASSMKGNPVNLTDEELMGILKKAVSWTDLGMGGVKATQYEASHLGLK